MFQFRRVSILLFEFILFAAFSLNVKSVDFKFQQTDYQIKFERKELVRFNKDYVKFYNSRTFKYNRTAPVVNETFEYKIDIGLDLEIIVQAYVFLSNEYRYFPIRLEVNFCEAISKNYIGAAKMTKCGNFTGCPLRKGIIYHICHWSPTPTQFPPFVPDGRYMLEHQALYHENEVWVARAYGIIDRPIPIPGFGNNKTKRNH